MTRKKIFRSLKIYLWITMVLLLSVFFVLKLVEDAAASNNDDFYETCIELNNSSDLNNNNEQNSAFLNKDYRYSYEDYIKSNINLDFSNNNKFESKNIIILKQTLCDLSKMNSDTSLDELHYGSYSDAEIAMFDEYCVLYDLDDNSDYYVGYVNTIQGNVQDIVFARTNYNGEVLNDCVYDYSTGLIYVPKSYTKNKGQDNKESVLEVQMQMLIGVLFSSGNKVASLLNISIEQNGNIKKSVSPILNALDTTIAIPVKNEDSNKISVFANDNINITNKSYYDNGIIYINESPANLVSVRVKIDSNKESNKVGIRTSLDDIPTLPYSLNRELLATSGGYFNYVGAKYNAIMTVHYDETPSSAPYQDCLYGVNGFITDENMQTFANCIWNDAGDVDLSNLKNVSNRIYNLFTFYPESVFREWTDGLALKCGHIGTPAAHDEDNKEVRTKILAINEQRQYAIVGFVTATAGYTSQGACGIYKVKYESKGGCQMRKEPLLDWAKTNRNYTLETATYEIYYDLECRSWTGFWIDLDINGCGHTDSNTLEAYRTYYVREKYGGTGVNYLHNPTVGSVYIENINSYENTVIWDTGTKTYDIPCYDSTGIALWKADSQIGEPGIPGAGLASFEGALYEYKFYTDYFKKKSEIDYHKESYQRHWVMKTDEKGKVGIGEEYRNNKVDGDDFYYDEDGCVANPMGTYVIHEIKAPEGYLVSDKYYILWVYNEDTGTRWTCLSMFDGDTGTRIDTFEDPQSGNFYVLALEDLIRGDYNFIKVNENMHEMSYIPFKITSLSTGEWHIAVSDINGVLDTSTNHFPHSYNTNINDSFYDETTGQITDESSLTVDSGCWFGLNNKSEFFSEANDDRGALPYGTYLIEELLISKNQPFYPFGSRSFVISNSDYIVAGGNWVNSKASCVTEARSEGGSQQINEGENVKIYDRIYYGGLVNGQTYDVKAWLVNQKNGEIIPTKNTENKNNYVFDSFISNDSIGYMDIDTVIDTRPLINCKIVWFVEIYTSDYSQLVIDHKDIIDEKETLEIIGNDNPGPLPGILAKTSDNILPPFIGCILSIIALASFKFYIYCTHRITLKNYLLRMFRFNCGTVSKGTLKSFNLYFGDI